MASTSRIPDHHSSGESSQAAPRRLIIRLSSLGDVILASSVLEGIVGADWVVAKEFSDLLKGHSQIGKVWEFDRKTGLRGWLELCARMQAEGYHEVLDLHQTLRSWIARLYFARAEKQSAQRIGAHWRVCKKSRLRSWGYFVFKKLWPKSWRPELMVDRYSRFVGEAKGSLRPDLRYLTNGQPWPHQLEKLERPYYCVMPGAQWPGKRWAASRYASLISLLNAPVVVLGTSRDVESRKLVELLRNQKVGFVDGVGKLSLQEVAVVLSRSQGYVGNDTGLAHLAEAVGVPAHMVFGPTVPDQGFGPWGARSSASGASLWCRPCGKDGRACFRVTNRYLCMTQLSPAQVARDIGCYSER